MFTRPGTAVYSSPVPTGRVSADSGVIALEEGAASYDVIFGTPFLSIPAPSAVVIAPNSGGFQISATPLYDTLTVSGVTFSFGNPIPGAGYYLSWSAIGSQQ